MFERYTEKARRVIFFARYEASEDGAQKIEPEHLLAGLLREHKALLEPYLPMERRTELAAELQSLREKRRHPPVSTAVDMPLSDAARQVLARAAEEAEKLEHQHLGTDHLFLGLLREECDASSLPAKFGLSAEVVRNNLQETEEVTRCRVSIAQRVPVQRSAEGCLEIVDTNGVRLAIIGLTATTVIPRISEDVQLVVDGHLQRFRVVDVNYRYAINTPGSPYRVHHLSAVQVLVKPKLDATNSAAIPDAT